MQDFVIGSDHAGFNMKEEIKAYLRGKGFNVQDLREERQEVIPFAPVACEAGRSILERDGAIGILVCGTGAGMAIAANRKKGIRASILYDDFTAEYSRRHNNANILVFGSRTMRLDDVCRRIDIFLSHSFEGGKYEERMRAADLE